MQKLTRIGYAVVFFAFLCVVCSADAQDRIPEPSFEKVMSVRTIANPVISPDGKNIVFTVRTTDWKQNRYDSELWLVSDQKEPFQLTRTAKGSSISPQWSPDGRWIAFLADRGEKQQIHLIHPDGGEAQRITNEKQGINNLRWAPDGSKIYFSMIDEVKKSKQDREKRLGKYTVEDEEYRFTHLYMIDVKTDLWPTPEEVPCYEKQDSAFFLGKEVCISLPKAEQLTKGDSFTVTGFEVSPNGKMIAFSHQKTPLRIDYTSSDISVLNLTTKTITSLVNNPGYDGSPVWSPDSKWVLYGSAGGDTISDYYKNGKWYKVPLSGGPSVRLAADFDENIRVVKWLAAGIYMTAWQKTKRQLFKINPITGKTKLIAGTPDNIWSVDFSADGKIMAFSGQNPTTLAEIYKTSVLQYQPVQLTNFSRQISSWKKGKSEVISWKSKDGVTIEGVLYKPDNFDMHKKYPLLVIIHGGPTGIDYPSVNNGYVYPIIQWLAKGALILKPNYRGSAGYGEKFRSLNVRNLGVGDAWDVLSGVDDLIRKGMVDPLKMGAMGWSQGGYISAFLTTHSDRFKAISVGAGISDWMTYYVNTDIHPFTRQYLKATPWDDPQIYAKTSPITAIKKAKTPTLIQHGEFDKRVPIPNAYELYQGLQDMGVVTRLIVYKGFGHGINKPKERLAAMWHNWQWFAKYIWNEEVQLPVKR